MFTVVWLVKKRLDLSQEEFTRYWIQEHTPITAATPGMRAYRCYPMTAHDGAEPAFDAIAFMTTGDRARQTIARGSHRRRSRLAVCRTEFRVPGCRGGRVQLSGYRQDSGILRT